MVLMNGLKALANPTRLPCSSYSRIPPRSTARGGVGRPLGVTAK